MEILIVLQIFLVLCMFIIGTLFGSFLSLATYRIPRHEDIVATRSYCPNCKHRLGFFDLIPVLSYLFRGAKCKYCKEKISPRYFLLETINGIIFVVFYLIFGYTIKLAIVAIIYVLIILAIGSNIMKNKMTDEEKNEVKKKLEQRKLSKKSGVFLTELIAAFLLFITLMISAFVVSRNSNQRTHETLLKANANFIAVNYMEKTLATNYDLIENFEEDVIKDGVTYHVKGNVTSIKDMDYSKEDIVKKIDLTVSYDNNGNLQDVKISTLKGARL